MYNFPMFFAVYEPKPETFREGLIRITRELVEKYRAVLGEDVVREEAQSAIADFIWHERSNGLSACFGDNARRRCEYEAKRWKHNGPGALRFRQIEDYAKAQLPWKQPGFRGGLDTLWAEWGIKFMEAEILKMRMSVAAPIGDMSQMLDDIEHWRYVTNAR